MSSQQPQQPPPTTAKDELDRFAHYVEYRTRGLRHTVAGYLGTASTNNNATALRHDGEDGEEDLFVDDIEDNGEGWVGLTDDAADVPEDASRQIYFQAPPPPPGPIQQTTAATQRAALQALGFTGAYLELACRVVAEDVGWLTHTATFEDVMRNLRGRFPFLRRLGESYGRGAMDESARRSGQGRVAMGQAGGGETMQTRVITNKVRRQADGDDGELEEVSLEDAEDDDDWHSVEGETSMMEAKGKK